MQVKIAIFEIVSMLVVRTIQSLSQLMAQGNKLQEFLEIETNEL